MPNTLWYDIKLSPSVQYLCLRIRLIFSHWFMYVPDEMINEERVTRKTTLSCNLFFMDCDCVAGFDWSKLVLSFELQKFPSNSSYSLDHRSMKRTDTCDVIFSVIFIHEHYKQNIFATFAALLSLLNLNKKVKLRWFNHSSHQWKAFSSRKSCRSRSTDFVMLRLGTFQWKTKEKHINKFRFTTFKLSKLPDRDFDLDQLLDRSQFIIFKAWRN